MKDSDKKEQSAKQMDQAKANSGNAGLQRSIEEKTKALQSGKTIRK